MTPAIIYLLSESHSSNPQCSLQLSVQWKANVVISQTTQTRGAWYSNLLALCFMTRYTNASLDREMGFLKNKVETETCQIHKHYATWHKFNSHIVGRVASLPLEAETK